MKPQTSEPTCEAPAAIRWLPLLLCAAGSAVLFQMVLLFAPSLTDVEPSFAGEIFPWLKVVDPHALHKSTNASGNPVRVSSFLAVCAGLVVLYGIMLRMVRGRQPAKVEQFVFATGALFYLLYLVAPVMLSSDVYGYAVYGRVMSIHGGNPYAERQPLAVRDMFMPLFGGWIPSWYGPIWMWICAGVTWLTGNHIGRTVLAFRLLAVVSVLVTAWLIRAILRRTCPDRATQGLVFFLWNPLVVIETAVSGHNDGVMLALLMLGFWLHVRGRKACAVLALTLSAMLKFVTGLLIPLYLLMILRQTPTWRERTFFALRAGALAGVTLAAVQLMAPPNTGTATAESALSPGFYQNNFHELIFHALRRGFGEDAESVNIKTPFWPWWVTPKSAMPLHSEASEESGKLRSLPPGTALLSLATSEHDWLRVLDPESRLRGYVDESNTDEIRTPQRWKDDPLVEELRKPLFQRASVRKANAIVRIVTWLLFAAFGLMAAWKTKDFPSFVTWSAAVMLASFFLIITEIRPWYINWALAIAALVPGSLPARFAMMLSASVFTLYFSLSFEGGPYTWIATWRSIPAFVVPLAIFAVMFARRKMTSDEKHA